MVTPKIVVEQPPSVENVNVVELVSKEASRITSVSVYSGRAEITREFKFEVKTGQNLVVVKELPNSLDSDSLRVEGRGAAVIHDVTVSFVPPTPPSTTSPALQELLLKRERTTKAFERCKKSITSLESYLATMHIQHIDVEQIGKIVKEYDSVAEQLDGRHLELEAQLKNLDKDIMKERTNLMVERSDKQLNTQTKIGVFANVEGEIEIILVYAVNGATWNAAYDIRVDMNAKEEPVRLIYKALITQSTGEDWTDIPLTLETATPTFGVSVPTLDTWNLSIYKSPRASLQFGSRLMPQPGMAPAPVIIMPESSDDALSSAASQYKKKLPKIEHRQLGIASKGNVSATFLVPGLITIPSDDEAHHVTIVQLQLDAKMSWVCVPKKDTKTHLSAKIKNASQYTLLHGMGSIYVDGSFISRSQVPAVSPDETFDCPLGLDPSIRITYHPLSKKKTESGSYFNKTSSQLFTQHISVHNTKSTPAIGVRVLEQIPVSEDSQIQVNLVSPELLPPGSPNTKVTDDGWEKPVTLGTGVSAMWEGADEPAADLETLGRNGRFFWVCTVPPQTKVNLALQWEVTTPARTEVVGLE